MILQEHILLAPYTTLGVGGTARFFIEMHTEEDIKDAIAFANRENLPLLVLGKGSNVLVPDAGVDGVVLLMAFDDLVVTEDVDSVQIVAGAGTLWEDVVDAVSARGVFGIANLAGIPGSLGGAAVQNIGAYGTEFSEVFDYADVIDRMTGMAHRVLRTEAMFAYRTSYFKEHREFIIVRVALRLSKLAQPNIAYPDLVRAAAEGALLSTASEVASVVRNVRAGKFPRIPGEGTAGSFFKNPIVSLEFAEALKKRFPELPTFSQEHEMVKLSLAWLLDHVLVLKGYTKGNVRLYERQPIVVVTQQGATATEVDAFANEIIERVFAATNIIIEREVETFSA